jgi:hypothetical protein
MRKLKKAEAEADRRQRDKEMREFKDEMREFKDEMREFKDEMRIFREEAQADRRAMNKKWGDLANKMGTLVEDIVLPNLPRIFNDYFGVSPEDLAFLAPRVKKQHLTNRARQREFDAVGISERYFFINETKSKPEQKDVEAFIVSLGELADYFPEAKDRAVVPIFSALHLPQGLVAHLSRCGIYAMEMKDDIMDLLNFEAARATR